jgi:hypothetical protein
MRSMCSIIVFVVTVTVTVTVYLGFRALAEGTSLPVSHKHDQA